MADVEGETQLDRGDRPHNAAADSPVAMDSLLATLRGLEVELRQRDISETSSSDYCNNFCQALMHYAGSRNSIEHGLPLLEVYCLSITCFVAARPHLTTESDKVALVLKRLALSCFELLLSVPENAIPYEAWMQFHRSVQAAHDTLQQYGSTDLLALLRILGEGGAWSNPALIALLTGQPTNPEEVDAFLALEGDSFMEMRVKHLVKMGEMAQAMVLAKACADCGHIANRTTFRQIYVTQLCDVLPSEEAIMEISRVDGKEVLEIICNLETEGQENLAFILCTTFLTQQLQQESIYCSWELTLFWSKLQRRIEPSLESFLEHCLQLGAIARTVYHLLFLVRVIQTEAEQLGVAASVELCVRALQLPRLEDPETKTSVCKTVACLLPEDLEVRRACQLTEFLLCTSQAAYASLEELHLRPDQRQEEHPAPVPNSLRCELLLALKAHWPFDPEFWDWKTLKRHCLRLLGVEPEPEPEEEEEEEEEEGPAVDGGGAGACREMGRRDAQKEEAQEVEVKEEPRGDAAARREEPGRSRAGGGEAKEAKEAKKRAQGEDKEAAGAPKATPPKKAAPGTSERYLRWQKYKFFCLICRLEVIEARILHHSRKHVEGGVYTCPVCLRKFRARQEFAAHTSEHVQMPARRRPPQRKRKAVKRRANPRRGLDEEEEEEEEDDEEEEEDELDDALEPGEIGLDPSLLMYYRSTRDPDVLEHLLEQAAALPRPRRPAPADDDHVTFEYIDAHFQLQDREVYPCPATGCAKNFRQFKYLSVHLKAEHGGGHGDENARHYLAMKDRREKCTFCRRHFVTAYHHRRHRRAHRGERPYTCAVAGCGARFDTTNQLLSHKQGHGFRLSYRCQLRGCSLAFCDLGQLYHHEAQHFRDAAYCCTAAGCKKFYYSKRDFLRHLATHGIAFSEQDFAAQREERRRPPDPFADEPAGARKGVPEEPPGRRSGDSPATGTAAATTTSSSSSSPSSSSLKEPRGTLTCVAVCFDGRKFTCGFESCGRTFAQASEVQRHLRCAHPGQMESERRGPRRPGKARGPRTRERDVKIEPGGADESPQGPGCPPAQGAGREGSCSPAAEPQKPLVPPPPSPPMEDSLKDVLLGLGRLSLRAASPRSSPCHPRQPISGSSVTPVSCPPASSAGASPAPAARASRKKAAPKPAPAATEKRAPSPPPPPPSPPPSPSPPSSPERPPATRRISDFLVQPSTKPYGCEVRGCAFKSVTSNALKGHYLRKHGFSRERVKGIAVFRSNAFKPFRCHLCPRCYRQKSELRLHYMQVHQVSESLVEQMSCSSRRREEGKAPEPPARARAGAGARQGHPPQKRQAGKTPPPPTPPQKEERRAASAWRRQKRPKEKGGVWMLQSERENGVVRPGDKGRKTGAKPAVKPAPPALRDHRGAEEEEGEEEEEERASRAEGRGSRRLVAKGNLCYILTKYHKPYHCVHKDCGSAFTRQSGLVRHLQAVHRYNRAQLCLEEDLELRRGAGVRKADAAAAASAKPQRLHCTHKGCGRHFHNSSGLWQHRRRQHGDKPPPPSPPETPPRVPGRGAEPTTPPSSEEPIPQFRCSYGDCAATYHLYSSLLRHTSHVHRGQPPQGAPAPPQQQQQQVRCRFEGCTRVFSQNSSYMKHVFYRHCDYYDSVVLRLQNAHKRDGAASGCQKKLIISAALKKQQQQPPPPPPMKNTPKLPLRHSLRRCPKSQEALRAEEEEEEEEEEGTGENTEEEPMEEEVPKAPRLRKRDLKLVYRTQEEALQMCQDRCLPVAYPCMVQGCDSVLTVESSMRRHYLTCHRMPCHVFASSQGALVNTAERLEELIQRRSALSSAARSPHGVLKVEYQAEPENPGGLSLPMSLHSVEADPPDAPGPPGLGGEESAAESDATVGADDLLPRDGRRGDPAEDQQPPLARSPHTPAPSSAPAPVDLSPPATLRFTPDEPPTDSPDRECGRTASSASADANGPDAPTCPPLKCKSEPPEAPPPRQPVPSPGHAPPPRPFDLAAYKPMGFESSFLKFIQENQNKEEQFGEGGAWGSHLHHHHRHHRRHRNRHRAAAEPPATASPRRCRDSRRRGRSVKENSRRGLTVTVTRSRRRRPSPLEPLLCAGEYASVQNLRSILDRALTGCGDLAIKQLQYLRPVVVLERSKFSASSLLDLFPAKKTEKLVLRASS